MGFFKKIGKAIKKVTKQVSLKNVVKIASSFDPTGISRGVIDSIQAKKDEKKALQEQQAAQLEYDKQVAAANEAEAQRQKEIMEKASKEAEYQRQLLATSKQAVGGKIGIVAGTIAGGIANQALQTASEQVDKDFKTGVAKAGASMADSTINEWLKVNWWKVLLVVIGLGLGIKMLVGGKPQRR